MQRSGGRERQPAPVSGRTTQFLSPHWKYPAPDCSGRKSLLHMRLDPPQLSPRRPERKKTLLPAHNQYGWKPHKSLLPCQHHQALPSAAPGWITSGSGWTGALLLVDLDEARLRMEGIKATELHLPTNFHPARSRLSPVTASAERAGWDEQRPHTPGSWWLF